MSVTSDLRRNLLLKRSVEAKQNEPMASHTLRSWINWTKHDKVNNPPAELRRFAFTSGRVLSDRTQPYRTSEKTGRLWKLRGWRTRQKATSSHTRANHKQHQHLLRSGGGRLRLHGMFPIIVRAQGLVVCIVLRFAGPADVKSWQLRSGSDVSLETRAITWTTDCLSATTWHLPMAVQFHFHHC